MCLCAGTWYLSSGVGGRVAPLPNAWDPLQERVGVAETRSQTSMIRRHMGVRLNSVFDVVWCWNFVSKRGTPWYYHKSVLSTFALIPIVVLKTNH